MGKLGTITITNWMQIRTIRMKGMGMGMVMGIIMGIIMGMIGII